MKKQGNIVTRLIDAFRRYGYLLRQLVSREIGRASCRERV